jgi:hypothetical protein
MLADPTQNDPKFQILGPFEEKSEITPTQFRVLYSYVGLIDANHRN